MLIFLVNPSLNSHNDSDGMGRGFGRGFRGRGGIRPGMGRAEFVPAEVAMGTPWMGEYSVVSHLIVSRKPLLEAYVVNRWVSLNTFTWATLGGQLCTCVVKARKFR